MCKKLFLLIAVLALAAGAQATELLINGSFEYDNDGNPLDPLAGDKYAPARMDAYSFPYVQAWTGIGGPGGDEGVETKGVPSDGIYRAFGFGQANNSSDPGDKFYQVTDKAITEGTLYTLTFDALGVGNDGMNQKASIIDDSFMILATMDTGLMLADVYTSYSLSYTGLAGDAGSTIGVLFECGPRNKTWGGWTAVDDVSLVPEPATMALLGLGGLALIRRKR